MIQLEQVSKVYTPRPSVAGWWRGWTGRPEQRVVALADVTFSVAPAETLGIVGGNGSGKSTLLKIVAGLARPTSGRVTVSGRVAALLELGTGFDPDYTGRQNLELAGSLLGLSRAELAAKLPEIIDFSGLGADIDRPVHQYSAGMFMRLAFSLATSVEADVLVVDEVLAVGDTTFRQRCRDRLKEFRRAGGTLVLVSHDLSVLADWCPRVLWLDRGRVRGLAASELVLKEYILHTARASAPQQLAARTSDAGTLLGGRLTDGLGEPRPTFGPDDTLRIELSYQLERALPQLVFGVMISRDDWTCCFGTDTELSQASTGPAGPGRGCATLVLEPLQLLPGRYFVSASMRCGPEVIDFSPALETFGVEGGSGQLGVFAARHRWELTASGLGEVRREGAAETPAELGQDDPQRQGGDERDRVRDGAVHEDGAVRGHQPGHGVQPQ
ncbi:MAG: ABC transporter ATP-binding protein [Candidatus Riflebacteria bacterium]|nr:ABC transporter ATP-binding protein [Candidatus Riflebacteria bacterium]